MEDAFGIGKGGRGGSQVALGVGYHDPPPGSAYCFVCDAPLTGDKSGVRLVSRDCDPFLNGESVPSFTTRAES